MNTKVKQAIIVSMLRANRPDLANAVASIKVKAGWSYATEHLYLSFEQLKGKLRPFNIDTIQAIHNIWIDVKSDDGEGTAAPKVIGHRGSEPLTYHQEKAGLRREEIVTLQVPQGYAKKFTTAIQKALGREFKITALPGYREPETVGASVVKADVLSDQAATRLHQAEEAVRKAEAILMGMNIPPDLVGDTEKWKSEVDHLYEEVRVLALDLFKLSSATRNWEKHGRHYTT